MKDLLVATTNLHKLTEIKAIFSDAGLTDWQLKSLQDYPSYLEPEETGKTFAENAMLKAIAGAKMSGILTLADDSGLVVNALDGAPGVRSARYAADSGGDHDDAANRAKLLCELGKLNNPHRSAAFVCVAALATPQLDTIFIEGRCAGDISYKERGGNGFGYDSLFLIPSLGKTMAELSDQEKNSLSHRGKAMRKIAGLLKDYDKC